MRYINPTEVKKIEDMILDGRINCNKLFKVKNEYLNCEILYDDITVATQVQEGEYQFYLEQNTENTTLVYDKIKGNVGFDLFKYIRNDNKPGLKLSLTLFDEELQYILPEYFYKIDIFESLVDDKCIYIVRDISRYEGVYPKKETICFNNKKYIVITKFKQVDMGDEEKVNMIFREFIYNFLECALLNQQLIEEF